MRYKHLAKERNKKMTLAAEVLLYFFAFADFLPRPFEHKTHYTKRLLSGKTDAYSYYRIMRSLEERGWLKVYKEGKSKLYSLTEQGKLEALFLKAHLPEKENWDGKWRMLIFDIPEDARPERNKLRRLLKTNGFKQIQKSVFINPYPLNSEAISYLQQIGLDKFIRIFRIDKADNENSLKKLFDL